MTKNDKKLIECFSDGPSGLVFWSFRYFLGRMTIATTSFAGELARAWPLLGRHEQDLIRKELEEEFHRDTEARNRAAEKGEKPTWLPLGWDCDREAWQKVRDAYSEECVWRYDSGHDSWVTGCGGGFDTSDFACEEIKVCPRCGKKAVNSYVHVNVNKP